MISPASTQQKHHGAARILAMKRIKSPKRVKNKEITLLYTNLMLMGTFLILFSTMIYSSDVCYKQTS